MYKHWVFDLDGTLVDSFNPYFKILSRILADHGVSLEEAEKRRCIGLPAKDYLETKIPREHVKPALLRLSEQSNRDAADIRPFAGIEDVLHHLARSGRTISIWTSRDLVSTQLVLKHTGLEKIVSIVQSGTCVVQKKPQPEGIQRIAAHHAATPAQMVMIGDHDMDMRGGRGYGIHSVRASWHGVWADDKCALADRQFHDVADFKKWVFETTR